MNNLTDIDNPVVVMNPVMYAAKEESELHDARFSEVMDELNKRRVVASNKDDVEACGQKRDDDYITSRRVKNIYTQPANFAIKDALKLDESLEDNLYECIVSELFDMNQPQKKVNKLVDNPMFDEEGRLLVDDKDCARTCASACYLPLCHLKTSNPECLCVGLVNDNCDKIMELCDKYDLDYDVMPLSKEESEAMTPKIGPVFTYVANLVINK